MERKRVEQWVSTYSIPLIGEHTSVKSHHQQKDIFKCLGKINKKPQSTNTKPLRELTVEI
jgi:hypothetical protein